MFRLKRPVGLGRETTVNFEIFCGPPGFVVNAVSDDGEDLLDVECAQLFIVRKKDKKTAGLAPWASRLIDNIAPGAAARGSFAAAGLCFSGFRSDPEGLEMTLQRQSDGQTCALKIAERAIPGPSYITTAKYRILCLRTKDFDEDFAKRAARETAEIIRKIETAIT